MHHSIQKSIPHENPNSHYNLGVIFQELGQFDKAEASYRRALQITPNDAEVHCNLGIALGKLDRVHQSEASYRRALQIKPDYAEVHCNYGALLAKTNRTAEAEALYRRAIQIEWNYVDAHNNLGILLADTQRKDEAEASFRRALKINPGYAEGHNSLGILLAATQRMEEAEASYRLAQEIKPDYAEAYCNHGALLANTNRLYESEVLYRRALEIKPDYAEAYCNHGALLEKTNRLGESESLYRRALEIRPNYVEAYYNLGNLLRKIGKLDQAVTNYSRALEIRPDYIEAYGNLGNALQDLGRVDDAMVNYRRALEVNPDLTDARSNLLFAHNYLDDLPAEMLLAEARYFGDLVGQKARPYTDWNTLPSDGKCLRVGLVSGDLSEHPVGYFLDSILAALTANAAGRLELIAYHNDLHVDALTERIKTCCSGWHTVAGLSDTSLAQLIHEDGIDILIDLSGHTGHNRLPMFAWKPAPVQASWLGYFATTGVAAIDYFIADPWTLPATEEANFTEKIWRLPETRLCFTPPTTEVDVAPLPALKNGAITFGCFNNLSKMNDAVVALWARVLHAVPQSRLFLKAKQLGEASVRQSVLERFASHGIDADKLMLEGPCPRLDYLAAYGLVDIALDPFPYTGGATTAEALWMGVPVLTLTGERFLPRQGVGLMGNAGLPEWIATDADDYVARAVAHAGDRPRLAALRAGLRQQVLASPIFDAPRFARHFETALRGMWTQWCHQQQNRPEREAGTSPPVQRFRP